MSLSNDIPTKLRVPAQLALDAKTVVTTLSQLQTLGADNNLAYTYYKGMEVLCSENLGIYRWRPVNEGETGGTLPSNFTYPAGIVSEDGVVYSNIAYNFFKETVLTVENLIELVQLNNVGEGVEVYKGYNGTSNEHEFRTLTSTGNSVTITQGIDTINLEVDIELTSVFLEEGDNVTITGTGTNLNPYIINSIDTIDTIDTITTLEDGITTTVNGDGVIVPYSVEIENLQKTINTFPYTLTSLDDKHTIFIDNGSSNVVINVPDGLVDNFSAVFIQEGIGSVTVQATGTATLLYPSTTLQNVIKGQNYWAMIEKKITTDNYFLLGSLKVL